MNLTSKNIGRRSEVVNEIISQPPTWIMRWGNLILLSIIALSLIIANFIEYPDTIRAEAMITSSNPPYQIVANTSGIVTKLFVSDGDTIEPKSPLAIIDNNANIRDVLFLENLLKQANPKSDDAHLSELKMNTFALGDIEHAYANYLSVYTNYVVAKSPEIFNNNQNISRVSLFNMDARLSKLNEQKESFSKIVNLQNQQLKRNKALYSKGVISDQEYEKGVSEYLASETSFKNTDLLIAKMKADRNLLLRSNSNAGIERRIEDQTNFGNTILAQRQLLEAIAIWKKKYVMQSEIAGTLSISNFLSKGQYMEKGDHAFYVIPYGSQEIRAKLKVPAYNYSKIEKGQQINISLDSYPEAEFGLLKGTVLTKSKIPDNDGHYWVEATLPKNLISSYGYEILYSPNMKGSAEIITNKATLLQHLYRSIKKAAQ